jgi:uncharacterized protein (DUF2235 family)
MAPAQPKNIIVACDGTWLDSDNGFRRDSWLPWKTGGRLAIPSNVTRFCRAILPQHDDGTPQITYYQAGLGSQNNAYSFFIGGYLGDGISENIREAYAFICNNYQPGDKIFLVGFSRGAFTARSIGGLIASIGVMTKKGLGDFYPIFKDWENQNNPSYTSPYPAKYFPNRPKYTTTSGAEYLAKMVENGLTRPNIPVEAIAVWDTVGSLGVPDLGPFSSSSRKEYAFIDTNVPSNLRYAYQALALDDDRKPFRPTLWEMPTAGAHTSLKEMKQTWFPGAHSNVGGSYPDTGMADITLAWMTEQLSRNNLLSFDPTYLKWQHELNAEFYANTTPRNDRPWSCGKVYSTAGLTDYLTGTEPRTPGSYKATDPLSGEQTHILRDTREFIHPCVRTRMVLGGLGVNDKGLYDRPNWSLGGWDRIPPGETWNPNGSKGVGKEEPWSDEWKDSWKWVTRSKDGRVVWIAEDQLQGVEFELCEEGSKARAVVESITST